MATGTFRFVMQPFFVRLHICFVRGFDGQIMGICWIVVITQQIPFLGLLRCDMPCSCHVVMGS